MAPWRVTSPKHKVFHWNRRCPHCDAVLLQCETRSACCGTKGKYAHQVPVLRPLPAEFSVFMDEPKLSALSRSLNIPFSFAATETHATFPTAHGGMFAVQGHVYHRVRPTHGNSSIRWMLLDGMHPECVPVPHQADKVPAEWLDAVSRALLIHNPLARELIAIHNQVEQPQNLSIHIQDSGTVHEVAALISLDNTSTSELSPRTAIALTLNGEGKTVPVTSRLWEPLAYPIFFPYGEPGWGVDSNLDGLAVQRFNPDSETPGTQIWWYRRRLLGDERFHIFGRLGSEYMVDMLSRNLDCRLQYIKTNLNRIRREEADLMGSENPDETVSDGDNVYLPASFLGSIRWAHERTADALAVAQNYGPPTFFVTLTCNPRWPDIANRLRPGQSWQDIPLIVARVFKGHLTRFLEALKTMFPDAGPVQYLIHRIEFQKRGLPHAHILIRYENEMSIADIDAIVSAEMPLNRVDASLVEEFMTHHHPSSGPLGEYCDPKQTGVCRHGYPKPIVPDTTFDSAGRAEYRRRRNGDQWVVSHSLALLRAFHAHINVEVASSSQIFQYIFKYIHKRADHAQVVISCEPQQETAHSNTFDEIKAMQTGRYLSAGEAAWRIMGFHITSIYPAVSGLPVHTQGSLRHRQYHRKDGSESSMTDLERYFVRPEGSFVDTRGVQQMFKDLTYVEYYETFWHKRVNNGEPVPNRAHLTRDMRSPDVFQYYAIQRGVASRHVARIHRVLPTAGEAYYIGLLLRRRPASSWEDLRTVDGELHATFQEAAIAAGIFENANEAELALREAVKELVTPAQLRKLFTHLLMADCCEAPLKVWAELSDRLSDDYYYYECDEDRARATDLALQNIGETLDESGRQLSDFGLPTPARYDRLLTAEVRLYAPHPEELAGQVDEAYAQFNAGQRVVFDALTEALQLRQGAAFFVAGGAGRGKTFLINALCDWVRSRSEIAIPTASSAAAATLYPGGRTTHSTFKVSVNDRNELISTGIIAGSPRATLLAAAALFVWDEAPMANRAVLSCVHEALQIATQDDALFGGKVVVLLGDFRQTCPVVQKGSRQDVVDASIRSSPLWPMFRIFHLTEPIRDAEDPEFSAWVDALGNGEDANPDMTILRHVTTEEQLIDATFPAHILADPEQSCRRSILAVTNYQVEAYNARVLKRMDGESRTYYATDVIKGYKVVTGQPSSTANPLSNASNLHAQPYEDLGEVVEDGPRPLDPQVLLDFFIKRTPPGCPPWALTIKEGAVYRLLRNFSIADGLVKNARVLIRKLGQRIVTVQLLSTSHHHDSEDLLIPRISFECTKRGSGHVILRKQFPLAPAYATTFNSCQGLTLDRVAVDLTKPAFSHGQLYTALSRVRRRQDCVVRLTQGNITTDNVVYTELLS